MYKENQKKVFKEKELIVYRVTQISEEEIAFFQSSKGESIELLGFISTSKDSKITTRFYSNSILTIQIDESVEREEEFDYGYAEISRYSLKPDEK